MEPDEKGGRPEARRPLMMDPAGARPSGFAPPTVLTPTADTAPPGMVVPAVVPPAPGSPSVLATTPDLATPGPALPGSGVPGEAAFGPVSQVVRLSIRTMSSRIDLVLPDRSTIAETLETVLELAPRSLREQAIAHGGWILRTPAGEAIPGSTTLLDHGIVDGSTLFLSGIDAADTVAVYDDLADAVADTVRDDPSTWPAGGGRAFAVGTAGLFAAIICAALLWSGPPWTSVALGLAVVAIAALIGAGLLARRPQNAGGVLVTGLLWVTSGAAAAAVATAGTSALGAIGAPQLLLGVTAAAVLAGALVVVTGTGRMVWTAIITGSVVVGVAAGAALAFGLPAAGGAAVLAGLAVWLMPAIPAAALRLAGLDPRPLPGTADDGTADDGTADRDVAVPSSFDPDTADRGVGLRDTVDAGAVREHTRLAIGAVTALIQGLTWPALAACVVLAFSQDLTGEILAGVVGLALLLRARLFPALWQRLPLLIAGVITMAVLLIAVVIEFDDPTARIVVAGVALAGMVGCLFLATRRRTSPALARAADIADLVIAVAVVPLVAGVLGLFGFIRGLGG